MRLQDMGVDLIDHGIIEVVADAGIEVCAGHIHSLLNFCEQQTPPPQGLLANRINSYSFSFSAFTALHANKHIRAVAEVTHGRGPNFLIKKFWPSGVRLQFFSDREMALDWLRQTLDAH